MLGPEEANQEHRINLRRLRNVLLIWLDPNIDESNADCRNTIAQLRHTVNDVNAFTDVDRCIEFIKTIDDSNACMIVSTAAEQAIVSRMHGMSQVHSIFIVCGSRRYDEEWLKDCHKIKGVFTEITPTCASLKQAVQQCEHNATPMSFMASEKREDQLKPSFMYAQILKEILLTITFDEEHIKEYVRYCQEVFADNTAALKDVEEVECQYHAKTPIWWYTRESFLYRMLNRALRLMDGDIITRMGFLINDLHRHIAQLHKEQYADRSAAQIFTLYRGQGLSEADFTQLRQTRGGLVAFDSFLSTSKSPMIPLVLAESAATNPHLLGVLFKMTIDPAQSTTPFASVEKISAIGGEDEVLFSMHSVFRIHDLKAIDGSNRVYEVYLSLTTDNDQQLCTLTDCMRGENASEENGWYRLGSMLVKIGQFGKAKEIYERLLGQASSESERAPIYNKLGLIKHHQGEHQEAIMLHRKALSIQQQALPVAHLDSATSYMGIGTAYSKMGDYPQALSSYEEALTIRERSLPSTHPHLAMVYANIGAVYTCMGAHPKALSHLEKALAIEQQSLPPIHPHLAISYHSIGNLYNCMGDHPNALSFYEKALVIRQQSLPSTHPSLADSYNSIGLATVSIGDYPQALSHFEKAMSICQQSRPSAHPDWSLFYKGIGLACYRMGDSSKALSYFEKALAIEQQSLLPISASLASSHNIIGLVYSSLSDYPQALSHFDKALGIWQQSLPSTHPDLALVYTNIGNAYENMGDYSKALSSYEKVLAIDQQSLSPTNPRLAVSYWRIGFVYQEIRDYSKACSFYEHAVENAQQSYPADHPDLERYKTILECTKKIL